MKRNQLLIGGAAVLVIVLLWWFLLYKPLGDDLSSAQAQTAAEQKKTDGYQADLARLQSQAKNASQQQAQLAKLDAAVPKNPNLAEFIIQANDIANSSGITFLSIAPSPPAAGTGGASVINMTISITGSFFQLQDYLRQLEQLERLVIVDGISITSSGGGSSGSSSTAGSSTATSSSTGDTSLSVSLTARMFTRAAPTSTSGSTGSTGGTGSTGSTTTTTTPGGSTSSTTATTAAPNASGGT